MPFVRLASFLIQHAITYALIIALVLGTTLPYAHAQSESKAPKMSMIRDAEIESNLQDMIFPILDAAGVDHNAFRLYLVQNSDLNAFVAGGQNMFIHTGLLIRSEDYTQIMGVAAHETGHITGGHLARRDEDLGSVGKESLLVQILAATAMALGGGPAGVAILGAGAQFLQRNTLAYTRTQERSADQAGLGYLQQLGISAEGLLRFFKILQDEQKLVLDKPNPYLQSHPLTEERMQAIQSFLQSHPQTTSTHNAEFQEKHARIRAKLIGFLLPPRQVESYYPSSNHSFAAIYAHAIAEYRQGESKKAVARIDELLKQEPQNPYLHELKGQVMRESPDAGFTIGDAITSYQKAVTLAPTQPLIRLELTEALMDRGHKDDITAAQSHMQIILRDEPRYGAAWRMQSVVEGKAGNIGLSALALAELSLLQGDKKRAKQQAERAVELLKLDPIGKQRAEDIKNQLASEEKK